MEIQFTYTDGRSTTARILPIDRIMFERHFHTSLMSAASHDQREEHFLWLGWHALNRVGQADGDFDRWLAMVAQYDTGGDPEVPTDPVANTGQ